MSNKFISYLSDFFILLLVFSFFNDNFIVDNFGEQSLKILFILFFIFYILPILRNLKTMTTKQDKLLFAFFTANTIVFLLQIIVNPMDDIVSPALLLIASLTITIYFSRYPISKLLYFIWASMMASVVMCYFNDPISEWTFRTTGGTGDPNEFATQLLIFLFVSFYLYSINKSRIFLVVSMLFFLYGLFYAGSMSSFIALGIIAIFYLIINFQRLIKYFLSYKGIILIAVLLSTIIWVDFTKVEAVSNMLGRTEQTGTVNTRLDSWISGLHMIEENPILGVGINSYDDNSKKYAEVFLNEGSTAPHNVFVKLAAESGVIVFVLFLAFLSILFFKNFRFIVRSSFLSIWLASLSVIFMGLSLGITYDKYFWLAIAMLMHVNYLFQKGYIRS